jgi:hypothetical protein
MKPSTEQQIRTLEDGIKSFCQTKFQDTKDPRWLKLIKQISSEKNHEADAHA